MTRARLWLPLALAMITGGCDLPELSEGKGGRGDMAGGGGGDGDQGVPADSDLGVAAGADLAGSLSTDMSDDPNIPSGAQLGSCNRASWTATASDSHPVNPPSYAIDGLEPTRWTTGAPQAVGQYIQIDFGGFVMVDQVTIQDAYLKDGLGDFARGLDVRVSADGADFSRVLKSASWTDEPGLITLSFPAHAARVLRLAVIEGQSVPWWTIHEIGVGCSVPGGDGGTAAPDMALPSPGPANPGKSGWTATASASAGSDVVANAFDGNVNTRWADGKAPQYGDEWFQLDLGQPFSIGQVWLTAANGDFPVAYALDLSGDGSTWKTVATGLGSDLTKIWFPTQTARYVRIRQIGSGYDRWWGIQEITVYQ
jgi:hypothetical protein